MSDDDDDAGRRGARSERRRGEEADAHSVNGRLRPPAESCRNLDDIEAHLEAHVGPVASVFHELLSDIVHLDILVVPPGDERPYTLLVTSGVSDLPMKAPEGLAELSRAEVMIALPPDWPLAEESFEDEAVYWPIRLLKFIGRLPHEFDTWIGPGHTVTNGDPAEAIADTRFVGAVLFRPTWLDDAFFQLEAESGDLVNFYYIAPLYAEEMELKLERGVEAIERAFAMNGVSFIVDPARPNAARKA